jgi:hypothetical protein
MTRTLFVTLILTLTTVGLEYCYGGVIVERISEVEFSGAQPGTHNGSEPFFASNAKGDAFAVLHLGEYSEANVGMTSTFTRQAANASEWDALIETRRIPFEPSQFRNDRFWLGLDFAFAGIGFPSLFVAPPTYNLQQVDVTLDVFRRWFDAGNTYRIAKFTVRTITLIPEPASGLLIAGALLASLGTRRRKSTL